MKIAIGTTSNQKIKYLEEVLKDIGIRAEIILHKAESGVSEQPTSEEETSQGSINRASEALTQNPEADLGLGIEVGYHSNKKGDYEMFCCASIVDKQSLASCAGKNGFSQSCFSSRFLLPPFHQKILKSGKYLGEYVREYKKEVNDPVTNYVRELVRGRKPLIIEATRNALLNYLERY